MHEVWPAAVWLCPDGQYSQLLEGGVVECFPAGQVEHMASLAALVNCPPGQTSDEVFVADASMAPKMSTWATR